MNTLIVLVHTPLAKALGWTLLHFLWEGALIAALVSVGLFLCRPASARARYGLACVGLFGMFLAFGVTLAALWPIAGPGIVVSVHSGLRAAPPGVVAFPAPPVAPPDRLPWIVPFWMAGVLVFYLRTTGGCLAAQRLRRRGTMPAPEEWQERLRALAARLRLTRPVVLLESCLAETPVVIGLLRPAILVPAGLLTGIAADQLEAILMHELAHIRRHDYAVNVMQSLTEGLLFYHPAVWWLSGVVRAERENCCDDAVVALRGDAAGYAAALAALETRRSVGEPALAANGGNLMRRIRRLLEPEKPRPAAGPVLAAILLLAPIAVGLSAWQSKPPAAAVLVAQAQPAPKPALPAAQYRKWIDEDVAYIISTEERAAFERVQTDEEREKFIEQFWLRRDPTPGTVANEFKEEHYRRIAYVNEHFAAGIPGWKTDRGRVYITYGPPDDISVGSNYPPPAGTYHYQQWRYRFIEGVGNNVIIEFVDRDGSGEFRMTVDPSEKGLLFGVPNAGRVMTPGSSTLAFQVEADATAPPGSASRMVAVSVPTAAPGHTLDIYGRITTMTRRRVYVFEDTVSPGSGEAYRKQFPLAPGRYQAAVIVKDMTTGLQETGTESFEVK